MILEIHGAGFDNKGAELMLRAVVNRLHEETSNILLAIDPWYGSFKSRCELGLYQILPFRTHVGTPGFSLRFKRQQWLCQLGWERWFKLFTGTDPIEYGCVGLSRSQGLIDIAGFAYTDEWGEQPTIDFSLLTSYYRSKSKPVILMPQAFGPFRSNRIKMAFRQVLENATLVFARDTQSYEYALDLSSESGKISLAPDIALFYPKLDNGSSLLEKQRYVCIVPNARLLDQGMEEWGENYFAYLVNIIKEILNHELSVRIAVFDTSRSDLELAQRIYKDVDSVNVTLVQENDPLMLKRIIGNSLFLIGSRYHSLVSAFSMQVPSVALGWSHKYKMLFRDFGMEEYVISADIPFGKFVDIIQELIGQSSHAYREQIARCLQEKQSVNQAMWTKILDTLKNSTKVSL